MDKIVKSHETRKNLEALVYTIPEWINSGDFDRNVTEPLQVAHAQVCSDLDKTGMYIRRQNAAVKLSSMLKAYYRHIEYKKMYFWTPPSNASSRRSFEHQWSIPKIDIYFHGYHIVWEQSVECSCRNIYTKSKITIDGKKSTITKIKNIIITYIKTGGLHNVE